MIIIERTLLLLNTTNKTTTAVMLGVTQHIVANYKCAKI